MDANGLEPASVLLSPARSANVFTPSTDTIAASAPWDMKRATTSSVQPAPRPSRSRSARHESGTSAAQSGIHAHPMNLDGATPEPSKTVVPCKRYRGFESPPLRIVSRKTPRSGSQQGPGGFRTREGASACETVPLDCRAASGPSRAGRRDEDGSLRSKMRESPPLRFGKPRMANQDPVQMAGFWRLSGEFGGKWGAGRGKHESAR